MNTNQGALKDTFCEYIDQVTNQAMLSHAIGLGSSLGIFDKLAEFKEPATSDDIAKSGKWKTRYIKEWLNLMVTGQIVDYDKESKKYFLPKHRHDALIRMGPNPNKNMSVFMEGMNIITGVGTELAQCFHLDGSKGVEYSSYVGFHDWRNKRIEQRYQWPVIKSKFDHIPNLITSLENGIKVCDGGCSSGHQIILLAEQFPKSNFTGFDIDKDAIESAKKIISRKNLKNIKFDVLDACNMPEEWTNSFDLFEVWDVVHDVPQSKQMLKEILRVLKPGGLFFMNDINVHTEVSDNLDIHQAPLYYGMSLFHCMPVSLYHDGEGLGAAWGVEKQALYLKDAGFCNIRNLVGNMEESQSYFQAYKPK